MLKTKDDPQMVAALTQVVRELREEVHSLQAQLDADFSTSKLHFNTRQGWALAKMQERIVNQRFVLRTINELGRGLTHDEWVKYSEHSLDSSVTTD